MKFRSGKFSNLNVLYLHRNKPIAAGLLAFAYKLHSAQQILMETKHSNLYRL